MLPLIQTGGGSGGSGTPGGSNTQVQFNNSGAFGGDSLFTWDTTNKGLMLGGPASANAALQIVGATSTTLPNYLPIECHSSFAVGADLYTHATQSFRAPVINFFKSRGTQGSPVTVSNGDSLGYINFGAYDTASYATGVQIQIQSSVTWSTSNHSSTLVINTVPAGSLSTVEALRIGSNADAGGDVTGNISRLNWYVQNTKTLGFLSGDTVPEVAFSRLTATSMGLGNGTLGDFSGTLKLTILNAVTGIQIAGAAPLANVLRGDGTNFVSAQLGFADLGGSIAAGQIGSGTLTWDKLGNAAGALTLANAGNATTFNQTSAVTWTWANTTAATSGTSQSSPIFSINGKYWDGAASQTDSWTIQNVVANGTNGTSQLQILHTGTNNSATNNNGVAIGNLTASQPGHLILLGTDGSSAACVFSANSTNSGACATTDFSFNLGTGRRFIVNTGNATAVNGTVEFQNTTSSTSILSQFSPRAMFSGTYWTGAASAVDTWSIQNVLASGTNGASTLAFTHSGSTGNSVVSIPNLQITPGTQAGLSSVTLSLGQIYFAQDTGNLYFGTPGVGVGYIQIGDTLLVNETLKQMLVVLEASRRALVVLATQHNFSNSELDFDLGIIGEEMSSDRSN